MMSTLVCTKCNEVRVETSRSVVLPFVCDGCVPSNEQYLYNLISMPNSPFKAIDSSKEPSDETATTEATVEMIADLEDQLTVAKELAQGQTELIEQLEKQNAVLTDDVKQDENIMVELTKAVSLSSDIMVESLKERKQIQDDFDAISETAHALAFYLGFACAKADRLEKENAGLKAALESASGIKVLLVTEG